jgi:hypothetical protein
VRIHVPLSPKAVRAFWSHFEKTAKALSQQRIQAYVAPSNDQKSIPVKIAAEV